MTHSVLASAVNHPDAVNPYIGLFNQRIVQSLMRRGMEVDVVSPRPFAPPVGPHSEFSMLPTVEGWNGYDVHHPRFFYLLPKRFFYGAAGDSFAKRVPRYVERTFDVPDVVHACHIYLDGYGMVDYCERHDVPLFVVSHGHFMNEYDELADDVREKVDETLDAATKVLCVSDALAEKAGERVSRSKVEVVPIGATPSRYPVERRDELREELGIDPDATVALFVGEFCERKGIPELAEILPTLDLPNTEFVFVGHGGDEEWTLRRALSSSPFSARHVYTGITSLALRRWLAVADVLVLPSHAEGRPTVIYEAMAAETAVLSTTVGGVPEQVADGETGVLIPPGDTDRLRDELTSLSADRERLREMGRRGRERLVEQGWTWDDHAERVHALHREALE
ncbi:hypothetical protein SAMN04487947_3994 [Halogeometricum rufum]|uniref:Uncharacterized protein n=1 Tax=Halogeometricum rufum TaxID=553469 RepID=A0A1I6J3I6_9EURY|nr:glycosyltransferase [Halogeometricum rufum]SFR73499.1 hypothetical protein SAMN04487947_3994 [Halogeometricum rufum]